jgi:ligand-binding sensor domain-containing protein
MNVKHLAVFLTLLLLPARSGAQEMDSYVFRHIDPESGLTGSVVNNMMQDRQGYIWISCGTDGLQRYDGERFLTFRHDPGDSTSIPYGGAGALFEDSHGTIWCAVGEKRLVAAYDHNTRQFRRLYHQGKAVERSYQFF